MDDHATMVHILSRCECILTMAKTISDFQFLTFPIGYVYRGSEVAVGSEDQLQFSFFLFLRAYFVQEGSSGTHFIHGQFEMKTFSIYVLQ